MQYKLTELENKIAKLYQGMSINVPHEIDMVRMAEYLKFNLHLADVGSQAIEINDCYSIFINENQSKQKQWEDFAHELGHILRHCGSQRHLPQYFKHLQEWQANSFMYHFCVPTFMLIDMNISNYYNTYDGIYTVAETFNVTPEFAKRRLEMFRDQMLRAHSDEKFVEDIKDTSVIRYSKYMKTKTRKFPSHTDDIVALAIARKKAKEGAPS